MKIKKKTIVITAASIGVLGIGAWYLGQNLRSSQVDVYPVSDLSQSIWQSGASLDGTIASQVSQEVHLQEKQIVSAVHVQEGQEVKKGDPLLSYDMTLVNIDLEMEKLTRQQLEVKKKGLEQELEKLKKDKAQAVSRTEEYQVEFLGSIQDTDPTAAQTAAEQGLEQPAGESGEGELPADQENLFQEDGAGETDGVSDQEDPSGSGDITGSGETPDSEEPPEPESPVIPSEPESPVIPSEPLNPETPTDPEGTLAPETSTDPGESLDPETPADPGESLDPETSADPGEASGPENPADPESPQQPGEETSEIPRPSGVYQRLYKDISLDQGEHTEDQGVFENAVAFMGTGTREDPYRFLCTKNVLIQGAFLNWAGGFDDTGARSQTPVYCLLEVRAEDKEDGVLLAAMLLDGNTIAEPVQPEIWYRTYLGYDQWDILPPPEEEISEDEEWMDIPEDFIEFIPEEDIIQGYSKEELEKAISEKQKEISDAELDIKEADLKIKKTEQQLEGEVVKSTLDGTVKKVGDPAKGEVDGEPFIEVESAAGAYIQGMVGEYQLDSVKPGQIVTGMAYESQMGFQAEITEVSPYPQEGYSSGMQEQSYYPFTAVIQDGEGFKANEMVSMDLPAEGGEITGIFISREYIRTQNGEEFVYKEGEDQRLKKQKVTTGRTFYGSTVEIKEGITLEDKLAFPYGKNVREGAGVREASIEELYSMY